jgi:beta-glucosidase
MWPWKIIAKSPGYPAKAEDFPPSFIWGVGTSAYQVESNCGNSSYQGWTKGLNYKEPVGVGCEHDLLYEEDIKLLADELHGRAYRFSIEWSKVEPQRNVFDEKEIARYAHMSTLMIKYGIKPIIGFHHYSDPRWFLAAGGFHNKKTAQSFVTYCKRVFTAVNDVILEAIDTYQPGRTDLDPIYLTFNSPSSYAAQGYLNGERPPGIQKIKSMVTVLCNMLQTHVTVYQALKKMPGGDRAQIGITHNVFQLDPVNPYNPVHRLRAYYGTHLVHDSVINFFKTGTFSVSIPLNVALTCVNKNAPKSLDIIGINNYSHGKMGMSGAPMHAPHERVTDNSRYTVYAEGLYRAIEDVSNNLAKPLGIPIIVTENGIGTRSDLLRDLFMKRYLYALAAAIKDGHDVRGYCCWSFMDNYEWGSYDVQYGLYHIDRSIDPKTGKPRLTRTLKDGARYFVDLMREHEKMRGRKRRAS